MNKEVLLIGGTSFIGFYTIKEFLNNGYKVTVTTRNNKKADLYKSLGVTCLNFDLNNIADINNLPQKSFESVILVGGLLPANVKCSTNKFEFNSEYINTNVLGLMNLLNYCLKNNTKKLISTTSYADTFNLWSSDYKIKEDELFNYSYKGDHCMYVISKNTAVEVSKYYNEEYEMSNVIFRLPPVYGVGPHTELYDNGKKRKSGIALFIELAQRGENITVFGEDCYRDIVYVKDVAKAFVQASQSNKASGVYNIMSGKSVSLYDQACIISDVFSDNKSKVIRDKSIKNNSKSYFYSIEKATNDFNYNPSFSDFKDLITDYKKELDNIEIKQFFGDTND